MLEIEIVDSNIIEGGIEVFARAWQDGVQIGFGKDGTVDIERFRIFNPPVLVDDPNGDIVQVTPANKELNKPETIRRLSENAEEATLQSLQHTITNMRSVGDDSKIIFGKIGNTVSTFYPDADAESVSVDGGVVYSMANPGVSFSTLRGYSVGTTATPDNNNGYDTYIIHATTSNQFRYLGRSFFLFDTSALPDTDTVDSATLSIFHYNASIDNNPAQTYSIVSSSPASDTALTTDDYDQVGSTLLATELLGSSVTQNAYNDFPLNASGLTNISKTGVSKFAMRLKSDLDNTAPTWVSGGASGFYTVYADTTGTAQDPKLVVTHSAGTTDYPVTAVVGAFTLTGVASALNLGLSLVASVGSFVLSGIAVAFARGKGLLAEAGAFVLTGTATAFSVALSLVASAGSFTLTGISAVFDWAKKLVATVASFILTGNDTRLRPSNISTNISKSTASTTNSSKSASSVINQSKS